MTKKILGLDLGPNSIGWAYIEIDETGKPIRIIAMGSRIIPLANDERDEFQKGQSISKNQNRTKGRTQRKGYNRKQLKKQDNFEYSLTTLLKELGIFPSKELIHLPTLELWQLRSNAATDSPETAITPQQLGRVLYMLNQKRGYKSARIEENQDKKDTEYVAAIMGRYAKLKEAGKTIGQHFCHELSQAKANNGYYRIKEQILPREAYLAEFDTIMNVQRKKHYFLTDEVIHKMRNEIIYYQRPLKSQKGLVNVCRLAGFERKYIDKRTRLPKTAFVGPKVAPITSPLFQMCKVWENVNHLSLKVKNEPGSRYKWSDKHLTLAEKEKVAAFLSTNKILTESNLLEILGLNKNNVYPNKQIKKGIQGNITYGLIAEILGESEWLRFDLSVKLTDTPAIIFDKKTGEVLVQLDGMEVEGTIEHQPLYQLWHTIYSIKDVEECKATLMNKFGIEAAKASALAHIDFTKQGFGEKSVKAMRKILPYLQLGYNYADACTLAGYNHSNSLTKEERLAKTTKDRLELLPKNSLRQPVVEKIVNQLINVVNAVIDEYGKPDEIRVELARELKQSKEERNDTTIRNVANEKVNDEVVKRLKELGVPTSKKFIQKYKYIFPVRDLKKIKEASVVNTCIYCGQSFSLSEALTGDDFDVDHIIPKALLFDDSQTNKVLVHRRCNSEKLKQTAYDYIAGKGSEKLKEYEERVDKWFAQGIISYAKMERLKTSFEAYQERKKKGKTTEADERLWEKFIDRQLRETQYIATKARAILETICTTVTTTEGTVTAKLRKLWGWEDVLMNLQLPVYKELEQVTGKKMIVVKEWTSEHGKRLHQKEEIVDWSKRDDHRHHAIDALVVACTQQGFIQRINQLNASEVRNEMQLEIESAGIVYNEKLTLLEKYLISKMPFTTDLVQNHVANILVSFKAGKKIATKGVRKIKVDGKKEIAQKNIIVPRGQLHEQFVYGKIKTIEKDFKTASLVKQPIKYLMEHPELIVDKKVQDLVNTRLNAYESDAQNAVKSLKKQPIYLDKENTNILTTAYCYKDEYVIKYKVTDLKKADLPYIVDNKVKEILQRQLDAHNGKEKEAFKDTVWYNKEKGIPIISVRCFTGLSSVAPVKKDADGNDIGFAKPGSNHHIAIYLDQNNNLVQHACTFWHAVERKRWNISPIIQNTKAVWNDILTNNLPEPFLQQLPADNLSLQLSMQQNETFVLGLSSEDFEEAKKDGNYPLISKHLYIVWSIAENDFWFRHHLETKNSELKSIKGAKEAKRFFRIASVKGLFGLNPIKIRINHLGIITKTGEYGKTDV